MLIPVSVLLQEDRAMMAGVGISQVCPRTSYLGNVQTICARTESTLKELFSLQNLLFKKETIHDKGF